MKDDSSDNAERPINQGLSALTLTPIGVVRSPFKEKVDAPRQAVVARGTKATIELSRTMGLEHAVEDLEVWDHIWVLFWFHLNSGWRPKVLPPRSHEKRGLFSTRSPHRPNPIGMSVVRLEKVSGLTLWISDVDMVDGTPVLDIKPYVPYADAIPHASTGWIEAPSDVYAEESEAPRRSAVRDPEPGYVVRWDERALLQADYLKREHAIDIAPSIDTALALGPEPHPYRRIKREKDGLRLAVKSWRVRFRVEGRTVTVEELITGYRARELAPSAMRADEPSELTAHRAFVARFASPVL